MNCPTCSHMTNTYFVDLDRTIYHCPECGALRFVGKNHQEDTVPKLVERCREFQNEAPGMVNIAGLNWQLWRKLGIAESIHTPENRPT